MQWWFILRFLELAEIEGWPFVEDICWEPEEPTELRAKSCFARNLAQWVGFDGGDDDEMDKDGQDEDGDEDGDDDEEEEEAL